jgi:hypothetical protein
MVEIGLRHSKQWRRANMYKGDWVRRGIDLIPVEKKCKETGRVLSFTRILDAKELNSPKLARILDLKQCAHDILHGDRTEGGSRDQM